jgi:hypothetical protein
MVLMGVKVIAPAARCHGRQRQMIAFENNVAA